MVTTTTLMIVLPVSGRLLKKPAVQENRVRSGAREEEETIPFVHLISGISGKIKSGWLS